ncbi:hypothetical protein M8J77_018460 [Diaphorina citri]|nr:hypothetical protein M8J77_018460 [Diaphorina citri]
MQHKTFGWDGCCAWRWPCLHQWLETCPNRQTCPVCKAAIDKDKVIPVYGRGGSEIDPRDEVPPRPQGQRTERENSSRGMFDDAITRRSESNSMWSLGESGFSIGEFLLGLFSSTSSLGDQRLRSVLRGSPHYEDDQNISHIFLVVAAVFILGLLYA